MAPQHPEATTQPEPAPASPTVFISFAGDRRKQWLGYWENNVHFQTLLVQLEQMLDDVAARRAHSRQEWKDDCESPCSLFSSVNPDKLLGVICCSSDGRLLDELNSRYTDAGYKVEQTSPAEIRIGF